MNALKLNHTFEFDIHPRKSFTLAFKADTAFCTQIHAQPTHLVQASESPVHEDGHRARGSAQHSTSDLLKARIRCLERTVWRLHRDEEINQ